MRVDYSPMDNGMKMSALSISWPNQVLSHLKRIINMISGENEDSQPALFDQAPHDKLEKIKELHMRGIISKNEYAAIKNILSQEKGKPNS